MKSKLIHEVPGQRTYVVVLAIGDRHLNRQITQPVYLWPERYPRARR
jgi:hypothetical protein